MEEREERVKDIMSRPSWGIRRHRYASSEKEDIDVLLDEEGEGIVDHRQTLNMQVILIIPHRMH